MTFNDEEIRMLIKAEQMMDNGEVPFVVHNGCRCMATPEILDHFGLQQGQTINTAIFTAILEWNIAQLRKKMNDTVEFPEFITEQNDD